MSDASGAAEHPWEGWRGFLVLVLTGLAGSAALIAWLFTLPPPPHAKAHALAPLEGTGWLLLAIMTSGRLFSALLLGRRAASEVTKTLGWRVALCEGVAGCALLASTIAAGEVTPEAALSLLLGVGLVVMSIRRFFQAHAPRHGEGADAA